MFFTGQHSHLQIYISATSPVRQIPGECRAALREPTWCCLIQEPTHQSQVRLGNGLLWTNAFASISEPPNILSRRFFSPGNEFNSSQDLSTVVQKEKQQLYYYNNFLRDDEWIGRAPNCLLNFVLVRHDEPFITPHWIKMPVKCLTGKRSEPKKDLADKYQIWFYWRQ